MVNLTENHDESPSSSVDLTAGAVTKPYGKHAFFFYCLSFWNFSFFL